MRRATGVSAPWPAITSVPPPKPTVGAGAGANVLVGGSNRTVSLQPVSVQGQTGLNLAAGVAELTLRPAR